MEIDVNTQVIDRSGRNQAKMVFAEDYILQKYWDGRLPVNVPQLAKQMGFVFHPMPFASCEQDDFFTDLRLEPMPGSNRILYDDHLDQGAPWLSRCSWKKKPGKTQSGYKLNWKVDLQLAVILEWHVKGKRPEQIDRDSIEWQNGIKIAKHILMPSQAIATILATRSVLTDQLNAAMDIFPGYPRDQLWHRLNKIRQTG